jgi:hypothetical protein
MMTNIEFKELVRNVMALAKEWDEKTLAGELLCFSENLSYVHALVVLAASHTDEEIEAAIEDVWPEKDRAAYYEEMQRLRYEGKRDEGEG